MGLGLEPLSTASLADLPPFSTNPLSIAWGGLHGADGAAAGGVWMLCQPRCLGMSFGMSLAPRNPWAGWIWLEHWCVMAFKQVAQNNVER